MKAFLLIKFWALNSSNDLQWSLILIQANLRESDVLMFTGLALKVCFKDAILIKRSREVAKIDENWILVSIVEDSLLFFVSLHLNHNFYHQRLSKLSDNVMKLSLTEFHCCAECRWEIVIWYAYNKSWIFENWF